MSKCWASPLISPMQRAQDMLTGESLPPTRRLGKAPQSLGTWVKLGKQAAIRKMKNGEKDSVGRMRSECKSHYWRLIMMHSHLNPVLAQMSPEHLSVAALHVHKATAIWIPHLGQWHRVTPSPPQKAWVKLDSPLFFNYKSKGITKCFLFYPLSVCWSRFFLFILVN